MSLVTQPKYNDYVDRFELILRTSTLLMPKTNGDDTKNDLVNQIIKYEIPIADNPPDGLGPPHIFISVPENPLIRREQRGRNTRDEQGPEKQTLEFYIIVVAQDPQSYELSQKQMYTIIEAITTTFTKNLRLTDGAGLNPLATRLEYVVVPYRLERNEEVTVVARNIVVRPQVLINLRT